MDLPYLSNRWLSSKGSETGRETVLSSHFSANGPKWQELILGHWTPYMHYPSDLLGVCESAEFRNRDEFPTLKVTLHCWVKGSGNPQDNITVFDDLGIKTWAGFCF